MQQKITNNYILDNFARFAAGKEKGEKRKMLLTYTPQAAIIKKLVAE